MVISSMCISPMIRFINSAGHGAPAMIPVLRLVRSRSLKPGLSSAEHHAEAMIHRDRDTHPVGIAEFHLKATEIGVVDDVVVGERRRLGPARGAGGELDVDRVVELQKPGEFLDPRAVRVGSPRLHAGIGDRTGQAWRFLGHQLARFGGTQFGHQVDEHRHVVAGLEARYQHKGRHLHLVQRVLKL